MNQHRTSIALFFVRNLLGIVLFWQGFGKIFKWGLENVYKDVFSSFEGLGMPEFILKGVMYYTSFGELIVGVLLVIGIFRKWAYMIIISILLIVAFGHGMNDTIWDLSHVMYRSMLLFPLLWFPIASDKYSIIYLLDKLTSAKIIS